jgi:hypothetical protein
MDVVRQRLRRWKPTPGDLVIVADAFSPSDAIIERGDKKLEFQPHRLADILRFLECIVLYDRIVVGSCSFKTPLSRQGPVESWFRMYKIVSISPTRDYEDRMPTQLQTAGVLSYCTVDLPDISAREHFDQNLAHSSLIRRLIKKVQKYLTEREYAVLTTWITLGRPLYVAEAARRANVPYLVERDPANRIARFEIAERRQYLSVVEQLRESIGRAAQRELDRIAALTGRTPFPPTPIAMQILSMVDRGEDLCAAALQLRQDYQSFRRHMIELDCEMHSDHVTLRRKLRILNEMQAITDDLWPAQMRGRRREFVDAASVIAGLPTAVPTGPVSVASLVNTILTKPIDVFISAVRRRRYRMLFRANRTFLRSKGMTDRLAKIFGVNRRVIADGLARRLDDTSRDPHPTHA